MNSVVDNPALLIIDDEKDVHYSFSRLLAREPLRILSAETPAEGLRLLERESPDVVVMDIRMGKHNGLDTLREIRQRSPKQIVIMMTAYGTSQTAIEAMKLGAFDYVLKPFDIPHLKDLLQRALNAARAAREQPPSAISLDTDDFRTGMVGASPAMQQVYKLVGQVAPTNATVLITGESGTGKELIARAIVNHSKRAGKTFVTLNCAAIPENLLESELFGHEKGAFTGAVAQRLGKFEQADGGTLFLDEIGEMPLAIQAKFLRVLQEGEFTRVGGNKSFYADVRIIAATNRNLWESCKRKEFREDLFYRLNVFSLQLPPLRYRLADIPVMVSFFINKWRARQPDAPARIASDALEALARYSWPGNVRELENVIQRALVLANSDTISLNDLPPEVLQTATPADAGTAPASPTPDSVTPATLDAAYETLFQNAESAPDKPVLETLERECIARALKRTDGNQAAAAKLLGLNRATLRKRLETYGL